MRECMIRRFVACLMASLALDAVAHDLLSAESVQAYLARVADLQKTLASGNAGEARAQASLQLGETLDEIRELLNRDLEAHGKVQGLASSVLMSELTGHGAPLAYSARTNRFTANLTYYREALRLAPSGPIAAQASFRLLKGYFYDSFSDDPLQPAAQSQAQLAEQIRLGEDLLKKVPRHAEREEASFILVVHYVQAARTAERGSGRAAFAQKARVMAGEFAKTYPESLRSAALPQLLEGLPAGR